jgi:hypothetical protein
VLRKLGFVDREGVVTLKGRAACEIDTAGEGRCSSSTGAEQQRYRPPASLPRDVVAAALRRYDS